MSREQLALLYEQNKRQLRAVAAVYVGDEADDVVQEAFLKALRSADTFRHEAAPLTWLHRIAVNASIDRCRRRSRREQARRRRGSPPTMASAGFDAMLEVRMALRQLTSDQRRVFVMADVIGHTHDEIARELAIPPGTSKWRLAQARRHLQRALSNRNKTERRSVRTAPLPQTSRSDF